MRKVLAHLFYSLDGVVEDPSWTMEYFNDEIGQEVDLQTGRQDAILLGRVNYEEWAAYWPTSNDEPFASYINNVKKYVVSTTLDKAEWNNTTVLKGNLVEEINKLKAQPGKEIGVTGSITLIQWLLEHDLVDELRLAVHPVLVGKGRKLFTDGLAPKKMKLIETKTTKTGVVFLVYGPDR